MLKVVFLRHGQSTWNFENRFTGWTDVGLTELGKHEAEQAAKALKSHGYIFDRAYTSVLTRAIETLRIVTDVMGTPDLPITKSWKLNERHYGALQGLNKKEVAERYGKEQVHQWRRGYSIRPPALDENDPRHPGFDKRYADLKPEEMPATESLEDTMARTVSYWEEEIVPALKDDQKVLVVAHGNTIRALVKMFDHISDEAITDLNIPTGIPLVYEFDREMRAQSHYYIGDEKQIATAIKGVADQSATENKGLSLH